MKDYIDDYLRAWALWAAKEKKLGISNKSVIFDMVKYGVISRGTGQRPEPESSIEQAVEEALLKLRKARDLQFSVIVHYYLGQGRPEQKAKDLGLSRTKFFDELGAGKDWLAGYFSAKMA